jgi:hypothetical protein
VLVRRAFVALVVGFALSACAIAEDRYESVVEPLQKVDPTVTCNSPFTKPDLASLKSCGEGKGHCFPKNKTPTTNLPDCGGDEICVPDKVLDANGGKLKSCTFFIGDKPGACVSTLVKDIAAHANELKQDVCDADERCAPCVDPRDGKDTKICAEIGVHEGACTGGVGTRAPSCCHGAGLCMNESGVPEDNRGDLSRDTCMAGKLCAPAAMVSGDPDHCTVLGMSGVCLDVCFAKMLSPAVSVARGECRPTEVCMPCIIGKGQGMPGC